MRFRRVGAILLGLGLLCGVQAKAYGLAMCPMHQAAQNAHHGHHEHQAGPGDARAVCNCVDACQSGCSSAIIKNGAPELAVAPIETRQDQTHAPVWSHPALGSHFLPFATAPPFSN